MATLPRKDIDFAMLDEPNEYRWEFKLIRFENRINF